MDQLENRKDFFLEIKNLLFFLDLGMEPKNDYFHLISLVEFYKLIEYGQICRFKNSVLYYVELN